MNTKLKGLLTLLFLFVQISFAQTKTVTGTVTDGSGVPLPGVNILVQGTASGTQSDFDGNYTLEAAQGSKLAFTYVGFAEQTITVGNANTYDIQMEAGEALDAVVVTALGIERKPRELSYSVQTIDDDALTKTRNVNTASSLVGKVSGLQINTTNGGVNPSTRVVLRGNRSLLGNNEALVVIDGFQSSRGALDRINPNDLENVSVLKGANAAALYGSDAANGVLIITTKKGKGKMNVTFTTSSEFSKVAYLPEVQDQFGVGGFPDGTLRPLENVNWGPRFDGRMVNASETLADGTALMVPFSSIKRHQYNFYNLGLSLRNSVQISSGDDNGSYLFSLDQTNTEGVIPKDAYNQTNVRLNSTREIGKLSLRTNLSFFRSYSNVVGTNNPNSQIRPLQWFIINTPLHVPFSEVKNYQTGKYARNEASYYRFYENPYFVVDNNRNMTNINEFSFINNFKYQFSDYLNATLNVGYTNYNRGYKENHGRFNYNFHVPDPYAEISEYGAQTSDDDYISRRLNSDFIISFNKDIAQDFSINANIGQNVQVREEKRVSVGGNNLIIPDFYHVSTRTGNLNSGRYSSAEYSSKYRKFSLYGDVTLGYKDFIYLTGSGRNDWTSTLPKANRSFFYPSTGISFIPTSAFPDMKGILNYLKGSFSYAKVGNDPDSYVTNETFSPNVTNEFYEGFPFGSTAGLSFSGRATDPNLKPEFTKSLEASLEFGFLKGDRISGSATVYKTNTTDQLTPISTSYASGATEFYTNVGEIQSRGFEFDLKADIFRSEDFSWNLGVNYSLMGSKVISLADGVDELEIGGPYVDNSGYGAVIKAKVGEPYPLLKTTTYQTDDQGRTIVGANGNPLPASDLEFQGKTTPDYIVGLNTTFKYKNFSLYAVADYRTGHVFYNNLADALEFTGLTKHSVTSNRQPFVFPNSSYADGNGGYTANTSRPTTDGGNNFWSTIYNGTKSNYVTDATVLKLREVSLSYTFDQNLLDKLGLTDMSLNIYGRNLLMLRPSANVYTDPEFNFDSGNATGFGTQNQSPYSRQYGLALTARF